MDDAAAASDGVEEAGRGRYDGEELLEATPTHGQRNEERRWRGAAASRVADAVAMPGARVAVEGIGRGALPPCDAVCVRGGAREREGWSGGTRGDAR